MRTKVTGLVLVRACWEGVGPLAFCGYATTHRPAGGEGQDAVQPAAIRSLVMREHVVDFPGQAALRYPCRCRASAPSWLVVLAL